MDLPLFQIDAFADAPFRGNPAAVVPLPAWLPDELLQAIAEENHISETAFLVTGTGEGCADHELRWFTPAAEVDLCGHATVASAHALFEHLGHASDQVSFDTRSGRLTVTRSDGWLTLDMPARPPRPLESPELTARVEQVLGVKPARLGDSRDLIVELTDEDAVADLAPDPSGIASLHELAVCVTAKARPGGPSATDGVDFVSRFFAPRLGVPEDPVTGSAHAMLVPWWAEALGRDALLARQISPRGGTLRCRWHREAGRVTAAGRAVTYLRGTLTIPDGSAPAS